MTQHAITHSQLLISCVLGLGEKKTQPYIKAMETVKKPEGTQLTPSPSHHYPRVLLIEDNTGDIELLSIAFEMNGMNALITTAEDGDEGLTALRDLVSRGEPPDLVLLDLNMPRRSGFEVLTTISELPTRLTCPVVVWTSSSSHNDRQRCLNQGAVAFFTKPERISDYIKLVDSLREFLSGPPTPLNG